MNRLLDGFDFIFKSYKHTALFLLVFGLLLTLPILTTVFPIKSQKVLGVNTQNNRLLAQVPNTLPVGAFDSATNESCTINGWAADDNSPTTNLTVHIYRDGEVGTFIGGFQTNLARPDVTAQFPQFTGTPGFSYQIPTSTGLYDGQPHQLYLYAIDPQDQNQHTLLPVSGKTITCPIQPTNTPTPAASCSQNSDCQQGFTCQTVGGTNSIPGSLIKQCVQGGGGSGDECALKPKGDANCDGKINMEDFNVWKDDFLWNITPGHADEPHVSADFNGDGKVDTDDFNIWRDGFLNASLAH